MESGIAKWIGMTMLWLGAAFGLHAQTVVEYIHTDLLGTPVAVTNSAGTVIERSVYEPYGQLINRPLTDGPGFTGHVQDAASGLTYMQQRYYDPMLGVFLSVDPVTAYSSPIAQFHRYRYANNNPYRFTDPDGRQSVGEMIDSGAEGCGPYSCAGWAALNATWQVFGAEGISQIADKGWSNAGAGSRFGAGWEAAAVIPFAKVARTGTVLIGSAQRTTRAGMASGHAFRQLREAAAMLRTGGYEKISLHRSLRTLTDGAVNSRLKPDVAGLRPDGKIDITEVLSPGQKAADLQAKYAGALGDRMGDFKAVEATKVMCTGSRIARTSC
ncbi:hypothetical protein E2F46_03130 [Luteimonas aestuarii]|uniref:Teneurin-like YD-shell domain-containing protein n=1 Tax=Luteimonas aestuarii TaxID=453837 RepID=A0A4R5U129_9GAMM|nr:RHS repeat-associated core domain-containing protein [Luteimonas aestuarii]TDK27212.1 hypothetical protein E2F46_03130 [Luteimonas aestuarii]